MIGYAALEIETIGSLSFVILVRTSNESRSDDTLPVLFFLGGVVQGGRASEVDVCRIAHRSPARQHSSSLTY